MTTVPTQQAPSSAPPPPPDDWIPVERRRFGFDMATLPYAATVAGLLILLHVLLPAVDRAVSYDDPVEAGDVLVLDPGVAFAPAVGWNIESGIREGEEPATGSTGTEAQVTEGDVSFEVKADAFGGDARALLAQVRETTDALTGDGDLHVVGDPVRFTTSSGLVGWMSRYASTSDNGIIAALTSGGTGVEVVMTATEDLDRATTAEVAAMLDSVTFTEEGTS